MDFVIGALGAALVIAIGALVAQHILYKRSVSAALAHETFALDRARAAELRSERQIDAMLERISTVPRLEMRPAAPGPITDPATSTYIADHDDEGWNEYRGEPEDDDE